MASDSHADTIFSLSTLGPQTVSMDKNLWLWPDWGCSVPRTRGPGLYGFFLVQHCLAGGELRGPLARPQANGCCCETTERALWLQGRFWRDPSTQCLPLFIYTQQKRMSLLQSAVTRSAHAHAEMFVLIIHKHSLNLNSLLTSAPPVSLWNHNEFPMIQSLHLHSCSSFHSSDS